MDTSYSCCLMLTVSYHVTFVGHVGGLSVMVILECLVLNHLLSILMLLGYVLCSLVTLGYTNGVRPFHDIGLSFYCSLLQNLRSSSTIRKLKHSKITCLKL